jgi:hypothetical protein
MEDERTSEVGAKTAYDIYSKNDLRSLSEDVQKLFGLILV